MLVSVTIGLIEEDTSVMYYINAEHRVLQFSIETGVLVLLRMKLCFKLGTPI